MWKCSLEMILFIVVLQEYSMGLLSTTSMLNSLAIDCSHLGCLLLLLLDSTNLEDIVELLLTLGKFLLYLSVSANCILNPRMRSNSLDFNPLSGIKSNHSNEEILETLREEINSSFSRVGFPENIIFLLFYDLVVGIVWCCLLEGRISSVHDEENHSSSENITTFSFVFFCWYLGGHIAFSTKLSM